jgi:OOP family OmpA-OmpF porin
MRISSALIAAGLIAGVATTASAETQGWYLGAEAGANIVPTIRFNALANTTWSEHHDTGYGILGQLGYGFGNIRLEGEFGYRQNNADKITTYLGQQSAGGSINGESVMGNAYYDFDTGTKFTPYLGVGLGGFNVSADQIAVNGRNITNSSQFVFAYQGIAGLSYAVNDNLSLKGDYRYLRTERAGLQLQGSYGPGVGNGAYASHSVMVGFTWAFGKPAAAPAPTPAAAPMPMPAPAPAPAPAPKPVQAAPIPKNFMVFFDFDKDALTPEAKAIITQAVEAAKKNHSATVALTGYTDLSGSAEYNLKLSVRRGDAVKKMMVQLGIPANEINVVGKGKSDPLVPTKDGVKEAQNRRVTIVLQ